MGWDWFWVESPLKIGLALGSKSPARLALLYIQLYIYIYILYYIKYLKCPSLTLINGQWFHKRCSALKVLSLQNYRVGLTSLTVGFFSCVCSGKRGEGKGGKKLFFFKQVLFVGVLFINLSACGVLT